MRKYLFMASMLPMLLLPIACAAPSPTSEAPSLTSEAPSLTSGQVINRVQVYGVSQIPGAVPVGIWSAAYEGEGYWIVRGSIMITEIYSLLHLQVRKYYITTWRHTNTTIERVAMELTSSERLWGK